MVTFAILQARTIPLPSLPTRLAYMWELYCSVTSHETPIFLTEDFQTKPNENIDPRRIET